MIAHPTKSTTIGNIQRERFSICQDTAPRHVRMSVTFQSSSRFKHTKQPYMVVWTGRVSKAVLLTDCSGLPVNILCVGKVRVAVKKPTHGVR